MPLSGLPRYYYRIGPKALSSLFRYCLSWIELNEYLVAGILHTEQKENGCKIAEYELIVKGLFRNVIVRAVSGVISSIRVAATCKPDSMFGVLCAQP